MSTSDCDRQNDTWNSQRPLATNPIRFLSPTQSSGPRPPSHLFHSPEQLGIPINYDSRQYHRRRPLSLSVYDSAVELSADPTPLNDLNFPLMNIDSNVSPSSGITSPMDMGFPNIVDEHSNDNVDINSITPSLNVGSSLSFVEPGDRFTPGSTGGLHCGESGVGKPLIKSDDQYAESGELLIPSASCPADDARVAPYLTHGGPFDSPTSLSIPRGAGGCAVGGGASGGSGESSVTGQSTGMVWPGSSSLTSPSGLSSGLPVMVGNDNQRVAMIRARTKKDSHNRIERKRRDYINSQITELGTLLPEELFRENETKKNKGSILKNSVEYINTLKHENQQCVGLYKEANLANTVINRLIKRIQDLEAFLPPEYASKFAQSAGSVDYTPTLREWSSVHEMNQQKLASAIGSPPPGAAAATGGGGGGGHVSVDTSESSPGMSSIGNNEDIGNYGDNRGDSNSPVPLARSTRTRCASLTVNPGQSGIGIPGVLVVGGGGSGGGGGPCGIHEKVDGSHGCSAGGQPFVGSLPTPRGILRLPTAAPASSQQQACGQRVPQLRPMFSPGYHPPAVGKHPSPPGPSSGCGGKAGKRPVAATTATTKMEESGAVLMSKFSTGVFGAGQGRPGTGFGVGLSTSLPVRMVPNEFPTISEMDSDDIVPYLRMTSDGSGEPGCGQNFKPEPMMEVSPGSSTQAAFGQAHSYQPHYGMTGASAGIARPLWPPPMGGHHHQQQQKHPPSALFHQQQISRPMSAGQQQQQPQQHAPHESPQAMSDELQFDPTM